MGKLSLLSSVLLPLQHICDFGMLVESWHGRNLLAGSRSYVPGWWWWGARTWFFVLLRWKSQFRQQCLALFSLGGRRSQGSPYTPALPIENTFFLLIVAHAEKTPKSPLARYRVSYWGYLMWGK